MSYQVIARKYRPQHFSDVIGQEHVTQTLGNAIKQKRIAHAYLFVGPRGTGKTTIARIFAKCLNCTNGPSDVFADDDPRCKEITEGRSLDVLEIDGASNRGIEEIRELRETVKYAPATSKFKIYIIDEVHMLTKEAFNALLKTLEEPPEHVKFMFATTEPEKVLPTILSRCQRFDLRRIPATLIVSHLADIAQREKVEIDEPALQAIARGAEGGMRDAESTLDQLISFCGEKIVEQDVLSMFGLTSRSQILAMTGAILAGDAEAALRELNELGKNGKDLGRLLSDLLGHLRNLLIFQVSKGDLSLLEVTEAEARHLKEQAASVSNEVLTRMMEVLSDCETKFKDAASKKILIEVAILKSIQARNAVAIDVVLSKLNELRDGNSTSSISPPVAAKPASIVRPPERPATPATLAAAPPPVSSAPAPVSSPSTGGPAPARQSITDRAELEDLWAKLLESVGKVKQFTRAYLLHGFPVSFERNVFTAGFPEASASSRNLLESPQNISFIQGKLKELGLGEPQVKLVIAAEPEGRISKVAAPPQPEPVAAPVQHPDPQAARAAATPVAVEQKKSAPPPPPMASEEFKNDPLIKKALEIFKGQIVEVRA